ncbi:MAG: DNA polymerase III subunit gamma/tau [Gammaproteobacteria bacterium]|nr:DNA polymerase III subunit gamma/tau [Gammaproteobacteria bacterium]
MSYQVLARKWRPRNFREMVGQEHVLRALINALDHDRLHHAYLFTGTRGVGKTTIARILARCLNCESGVSSEPCGQCSSCVEIAEGRSVDLLEVDAASRTKVEDTRELLDNVQYAPTNSRFKVYLIDEVHMLSNHSFNALLKTLEEPPPHVKFLLATTDPQKLPATVLSRCLQFNLKNMPPQQVVDHLTRVLDDEMIAHEEGALWRIGRAASGSMRDALSLTDQAIAFGSGSLTEADVRTMLGSVDLNFVYALVDAVSEGDPAQVLAVVAQMAEHGADFYAALDELLSLLHRLAIAQAVPAAIDNNWGDADKVAALAGGLAAEDTQLYYQIALNGKRDLPLAPEPREGFEMLALRMVAFRPVAMLDMALSPDDLQPASSPAAVEGGASVKKPPALDRHPVGEPRTSASQRKTHGPAQQGSRALRSPDDSVESEAHASAAASLRQRGRPVAQAAEPALEMAANEEASGAWSLQDLHADNWAQILDDMKLAGIVGNVALNCVMASREGNAIELILDRNNASLFNDSQEQTLRLALEAYFGESIRLQVTLGDPATETPAERRSRLAAERQQRAVNAIVGDAQLQSIISRFDGELDQSSIQPRDTN